MTAGISSSIHNPKHLSKRKNRADRAMVIMRTSDPALHAMRLRITIRKLLADAMTTTSPAMRIESSVAACKVLATWMELIGHPKRPVAQTAKGLKQVMDIELPADLVEQAESTSMDSINQEAA